MFLTLPFTAAVCLGFAAAASEENGGRLRIKTMVQTFDAQGVSLMVSCTLNKTDVLESDSRGGDVSLVLSKFSLKNATFVEVASVSAFTSTVHITEDFEIVAFGTMDKDQGTPYLRVQFVQLPWREAGEFECKSTSVNRMGRCTHLRDKTKIKIAQADALTLAQVMEDPQSLGVMADAKEQLTECKNSVEELRKKFVAAVELQPGDVYWVTEMFNASSFYVLTKSESVCLKIGGYLAEVNTEDEFRFLNKTLLLSKYSLPSGVDYMTSGTSYKSLQGPFIHETHPDDKVFTGHYATNEPHRSNMDYRWLLFKLHDGALKMYDGKRGSLDVKFLCEIPI